MGGDRSTEGTESDVGSKKNERKNTINTNPIEATSQSLLANFLLRSRELNLGIAIEEEEEAISKQHCFLCSLCGTHYHLIKPMINS